MIENKIITNATSKSIFKLSKYIGTDIVTIYTSAQF